MKRGDLLAAREWAVELRGSPLRLTIKSLVDGAHKSSNDRTDNETGVKQAKPFTETNFEEQ